jgi:putative transcriptional regulator
LGRCGDREPPGFSAIDGRIGLIDLTMAPGDVVGDLERLRVFSGYAGWGPGQLEEELGGGDWLIVDALADDPFTEEPDGLWAAVLRREGGRAALYANFPLDPSAN